MPLGLFCVCIVLYCIVVCIVFPDEGRLQVFSEGGVGGWSHTILSESFRGRRHFMLACCLGLGKHYRVTVRVGSRDDSDVMALLFF